MATRITDGGIPNELEDFLEPSVWTESNLYELKVSELRMVADHFKIRIGSKAKKKALIEKMLSYASPSNIKYRLINLTKHKSISKPFLLEDYTENAGRIDQIDKSFYELWSTKHKTFNYHAKWLFGVLRLAIWNSYVLWREYPRKDHLTWKQFVLDVGKALVKNKTSADTG